MARRPAASGMDAAAPLPAVAERQGHERRTRRREAPLRKAKLPAGAVWPALAVGGVAVAWAFVRALRRRRERGRDRTQVRKPSAFNGASIDLIYMCINSGV